MTNNRVIPMPYNGVYINTPTKNGMGKLYVSSQKAVVCSAADMMMLLDMNPGRHSVLFVNDGAVVIYLFRQSGGNINLGIRLNALGGSYEEIMDSNGFVYQGTWFARAASSTSTLLVNELSHGA